MNEKNIPTLTLEPELELAKVGEGCGFGERVHSGLAIGNWKQIASSSSFLDSDMAVCDRVRT